jgi:hypothetical protein
MLATILRAGAILRAGFSQVDTFSTVTAIAISVSIISAGVYAFRKSNS